MIKVEKDNVKATVSLHDGKHRGRLRWVKLAIDCDVYYLSRTEALALADDLVDLAEAIPEIKTW